MDVDGKPRYFFGDRLHPIIPGPGDVHLRPRPGRSTTTSPARATRRGSATSWRARSRRSIRSGSPRRPAAVHGRAGCRGGLAVPLAGRLHRGPDAARHRGVDRDPPSVQPLARRGLGIRVPGPHLRRAVPDPLRPRPGRRRARMVPRPRRPCRHRSATARPSRPTARSRPADPMFDPFWARVAEAGVVVAPHAGFEDGYSEVDQAVAEDVGPAQRGRRRRQPTRSTSTSRSCTCS